jgi:glyoxylase-like metal-dependent hydrolase (beta-lactamase superfamily II)
MVIYKIPVGPLQTNCYVVADKTKEAVIIDPGAEPEKILDVIEKHDLKPKRILTTPALLGP